RGFAITL
ncbi:hypothetical protein EC960428_0988, partial [Escherichia coli 96.0428]